MDSSKAGSGPFGIGGIGTYLPAARQDNLEHAGRFALEEDFITSKIGFTATARRGEGEDTSDLCVKAYEDLVARTGTAAEDLDLIVVVTQNPDHHGLPHTSAVVHKKLGLPKTCFAFDLSLGCSGYVAGLAVVKGFLENTCGRRAMLFTADPYSKILDPDDKNTCLIFGDGAAATLIDRSGTWRIGQFDMGTDGSKCSALEVRDDGKLFMNGRSVFEFCVLNVPGSVAKVLEANALARENVDRFVFHPGSKYIVDVIASKIGIPKPPFDAAEYGNTVSSSIPMMLADLDPNTVRTVLVSGFGVGLGWATTVLRSA